MTTERFDRAIVRLQQPSALSFGDMVEVLGHLAMFIKEAKKIHGSKGLLKYWYIGKLSWRFIALVVGLLSSLSAFGHSR